MLATWTTTTTTATATAIYQKQHPPDDHRYEAKPRPGLNIDVVRRLVLAKTGKEARSFLSALTAEFGGLSCLKCLPDCVGTEAAASRHHMLPVMTTVVFKPGVTVAELAARPETKVLWQALRGKPGAVPPEQWRADHDAAYALLTRHKDVADEQVAMHCEVQLMFEDAAKLRSTMHDIYKVTRAESGMQLYADLDLQMPEGAVSDLCVAAHLGMPTTVAKLVCQGGKFHDNLEFSSTKNGETAVYCASEKGHLACLLPLLEAGANPNAPREHGDGTPLYIAAQEGHLDAVQALLQARADPNRPGKAASAATPLHAACNVGHRDVVHVLLVNGANPNVAKSDDGVSPLFFAAQHGHLEVVQSLLASNADATQPAADGRTTPMMVANHRGHMAVCEALILSEMAKEDRQVSARPKLGSASAGSDSSASDVCDSDAPSQVGLPGASTGSERKGTTVGRMVAAAQFKQHLPPNSSENESGSGSKSAQLQHSKAAASSTSLRTAARPLRKVGTSAKIRAAAVGSGSGSSKSCRSRSKQQQKEPLVVRRKWTKKLPSVAGSSSSSSSSSVGGGRGGGGGGRGGGAITADNHGSNGKGTKRKSGKRKKASGARANSISSSTNLVLPPKTPVLPPTSTNAAARSLSPSSTALSPVPATLTSGTPSPPISPAALHPPLLFAHRNATATPTATLTATTPTCSKDGCSIPLSGAVIEAAGQMFHQLCFVCATCHTNLNGEEFKAEGRKIMCVRCWSEEHGTMCKACSKAIMPDLQTMTISCVVIDGNPYHRGCAEDQAEFT